MSEQDISALEIKDLFPILNETELKVLLELNTTKGIALDIDETLSWTCVHWIQQMQNLFGNNENLTPEAMAIKYHLAQYVPEWQGRKEVDDWMINMRENNEIQLTIPLINGAISGVHKIAQKVPVIAYITVRPQCVLSSTQIWLHNHGFPPAPILGKPDCVSFEYGNRWKGSVLPSLFPFVSVLVDDNPSVMRALDSSYLGKLMLFGHDATKVPSEWRDCVIACPAWSDVVDELMDDNMFNKYFKS